MIKDTLVNLALLIPRPVRRTLKTQVVPPALRLARRVRGDEQVQVPAREYRVPGRETFAGYYEIQPVSADGKAVSAHASRTARKALTGREKTSVGWFDIASGEWHEVAETELWCWQMGARLRWWDSEGDRILAFNAMIDGAPAHCLADEQGRVRKHCDVPLFDTNEAAGIGMSLNFARLAKCRPGYGYPLLEDKFAAVNLPDGDGVKVVDLKTGKAELVHPLPRFAERTPGATGEEYHYLNGGLLSPAATRFSVLYKRLPDPQDVHNWTVDAFVGSCDGSMLTRVPLDGRASHYWWLDEDRIVYTANKGINADYVVFDCRDGSLTSLSHAAPNVDGHPSLHFASGRWITDTYPDLYSEQTLFVMGEGSGDRREIGRLSADRRYQDEWRCDLHPRWSRDGKSVFVDSTHEGYRALYRVKVEPQ